jgi:hypothetical protein
MYSLKSTGSSSLVELISGTFSTFTSARADGEPWMSFQLCWPSREVR